MVADLLNEKTNMTYDCRFVDGSVENLLYLSSLNKFGRGRMRDLELKQEEFVRLLTDVICKAGNEGTPSPCFWPRGKVIGSVSILYGLLLEQPSVWVSKWKPTQDLKRKANTSWSSRGDHLNEKQRHHTFKHIRTSP